MCEGGMWELIAVVEFRDQRKTPQPRYRYDQQDGFPGRRSSPRFLPLQSSGIYLSCSQWFTEGLNMQLFDLHDERFFSSAKRANDKGFEHFIVPKEKLTLLTPWEAIKTYTFGTGIAQHYFCGTCGISPFYVPRSNPNGYSVFSIALTWLMTD
jgi:hypothetical protein